jgi:hypothetical protein
MEKDSPETKPAGLWLKTSEINQMRRITVKAEEPTWPCGGESERQEPEWSFSAKRSSDDTAAGAASVNAVARCALKGLCFAKEAGAIACKSGAEQLRLTE